MAKPRARRTEVGFEHYLSGLTFKQIAVRMGVSLQTIKKWCRENSWVKRREELQLIYERLAHEKVIERAEKTAERVTEFADIVSSLGLKAAKQIKKEGDISDEKTVNLLLKWAKVIEVSSKVFSRYLPSLEEDLEKKVKDEIERRNEGIEHIEEKKAG